MGIEAKGADIKPSLIYSALSAEDHQLDAGSKGTVYQSLLPSFRGLVTMGGQKSYAPIEMRSCGFCLMPTLIENWILKYSSARLKKPQIVQKQSQVFNVLKPFETTFGGEVGKELSQR